MESSDALLTLCDISAALGERTVLQSINLVVRSGELTHVIGPNGAGKSTLLGVLSGTTLPTQGEIRTPSGDLRTMRPEERARFVSMLRQIETVEIDFRVRDVVAFGRFPHQPNGRETPDDASIVQEAMRDANVAQFHDRPLATLSGGEQRRVHLARVLAQGARLVLLDEPASSLDVREQRGIETIVRHLVDRGIAAVVVTHDIPGAMQSADRIVVLHEGHVAWEGSPKALSATVLTDVFGVPFAETFVAGRRVLTESRE